MSARGGGRGPGQAPARLQADRRLLPTPAEALEDFLLNFLAVEQDGSGKTVTRPKYMAMLVRRPGGGGPRRGSRQFKCRRRRPCPPAGAPAPPRPRPPRCLRPQQDIANRQRATLEVELDDLEGYSKDAELVAHVERNTQQYLALLAEAADNIMPQPTEDNLPEDVFDVLQDQVGAPMNSGAAAAGAQHAAGRQAGRHAARAACAKAVLLCFSGTPPMAGGAEPCPLPSPPPLSQRRRAQEMTRAQMEVEGRSDPDPNFALPPSLLRRCAAGGAGTPCLSRPAAPTALLLLQPQKPLLRMRARLLLLKQQTPTNPGPPSLQLRGAGAAAQQGAA